ncbi:2Fe-2S iron-sulfur cluster binding domain-containing protein [candidate division KSB1 bacterium]|nr:2Fe-2S iron-sulfur cluster binding domain-containing protein [candidate division KSB1 bacterium]
MPTSIIFNKIGRFEVEAGTTILEAAQQFGLFLPHECGGQAQCTSCRAAILAGENNCSAIQEPEQKLLHAGHFKPPIRLACQTKISGPVRAQILLRDEFDLQLALASETGQTPRLPGVQQPLALLSGAWHDFERLVLQASAHDTVQVLQRFYYLVQQLVKEHDGHLIEFSANRFTAVWGASGNIRAAIINAMNAARRLVTTCGELNDYLEHNFDMRLAFGFGVHADLAVMGELGTGEEHRLVVLGKAVDHAHELCRLTQKANAAILVSETIFAVMRDHVPISRAFQAQFSGESTACRVFEAAPENVPATASEIA